MRFRHLISFALLPLASGCVSAGPSLHADLTRVPNRHVEIWSVHAEDVGDTVQVRGLVRRPLLDKRPLWGHLDVAARFADGRTPLVTKALWSRPSLKGSRSGRYSASLLIADATQVTDIIVSYAPGRHADEANPGYRS